MSESKTAAQSSKTSVKPCGIIRCSGIAGKIYANDVGGPVPLYKATFDRTYVDKKNGYKMREAAYKTIDSVLLPSK